MQLISTRGGAPIVNFQTALFEGLAPDGGLYVPAQLTRLPEIEIARLRDASLVDVAISVATHFLGDEISREALHDIMADALKFPVPVVQVRERRAALELFHGPTFAFKDVGARTMARLMAHFAQSGASAERPLTVLVATSGDTGSAVAQAFFGVAGTRVVVLFPEGQVTRVQEAQFTTLGGNVTAVAVNGTFDDCQRLVKQAFADDSLRQRARLTSANSINIGRLLPQIFYYVHASLQRHWTNAVFSVPSGNFGNLTAGLFAWQIGAPIRRFVAATTINDTVPRYLATGIYEPRPSRATLANAMDVGDPSNFERMRWLFADDRDAMREVITASVHSDEDVRAAITELHREYRYIADPHSAIGYLGTRTVADEDCAIFLATAHPAKFRETVEPLIGDSLPLPDVLETALKAERKVQRMPAAVDSLADLLLRLEK